ncbi:unnamed protein product [Heterobilharzia americana]|nr:unnamed protein product [Heterobilharzia americana]CAH8641686.1 unnamed protein product [Heterobilharzia americana]
MNLNEDSLNFSDYPYKVFQQCNLLKTEWSYAQSVKCVISTIVSVWCAYVLPFFSFFGVVTNLFIAFYAILRANKVPRQIIYISGICLSSAIANITFIWLWQFPVRGLTYASHGSIFFSIVNVSPTACRFQRYMYAFSSTMMCNMHICASLDRCLAIYIPTKLKNFPNIYGWYIYIGILLFSASMMLPFGVKVDWRLADKRILCWVDRNDLPIQTYHTLFSNLAPIQTLFLITIDSLFLMKIHKQLSQHSLTKLTSSDGGHLRRSLLLFISSVSFIIIAICQSVFYTIARFSSTGIISYQTGVDYDIADFFWYLNSVRELLDIYIYFKCFGSLRDCLIGISRRISRGSLFKPDPL